MTDLKDYLNSINLKNDLDKECLKKYPSYVVNKILANHIDCILHVNEMNQCYNLDKDLQYEYLLHIIRKSKRYSPWNKKKRDNDIELIRLAYGYNEIKAKQALDILTPEQLSLLRIVFTSGAS